MHKPHSQAQSRRLRQLTFLALVAELRFYRTVVSSGRLIVSPRGLVDQRPIGLANRGPPVCRQKSSKLIGLSMNDGHECAENGLQFPSLLRC